jgi:solute:Na+ symporter, SSS family
MNTGFSTIDFVIFGGYAIMLIGVGLLVSRTKKGKQKTTEDYFLAGKSLVWWAIGASCIAANISAEQLIGMTGSGFVMGIAMASYEFASAVILIFVGKFFLPVFIKKGIFTMPQFLENRYSKTVRSTMAIFWVLLYIFVNLTSILYMGALALNMTLNIPLFYGVLILGSIAILYSLYGGLSAVAWTDIIQVVLLIGGGVLTTVLALRFVSQGEGIINGLDIIFEKAPEKFDMVFTKDHPNYKEIPGIIGIVVGIIIVANSFYWGFNQYTIQRALAAKNIKQAQHGVMFAGYLKLVMPILVVLPGIAAFVILNDPDLTASLGNIDPNKVPTAENADKAYPWLLGILPKGLKGLAFAALIAAIVSSLASMINSTSTIFTLDIYKPYLKQKASEKHLVVVGRITAFCALFIASLIAPLLKNIDQAFQFIQEFTGFVSPGIVVIFVYGLFWKKATTKSALWVAALTLPLSIAFWIFNKYEILQLPFITRINIVFGILLAVGIIISLTTQKSDKSVPVQLEKGIFKTTPFFNVAAIIILAFLTVFYILFW